MSARHWPFAALTEAEGPRLGLRLEWGVPPAQGAMLRFDVSGPFGTLQLTVAADDWCPQMLPALEGLAWSELVDRDTLARWLPDVRLLDFADPVLAGSEVTLREVVPASLMARTRQPQPRVITGQGPAWIEQAEAAPHLRATDAALDLCVPVELEVARVTLPMQRLRSLSPGSVLLLEQFQPIARHRTQRLYTFDFTLETVSVNTPFDFAEDDADTGGFDPLPPSGAPTATPPGLDVARLPVTVEVVLCQLPQRVGDLAALQPGTVFNLPPDAWTQLQLRVNGQTIARGELVQVGEQLGVQLHQAPVLS